MGLVTHTNPQIQLIALHLTEKLISVFNKDNNFNWPILRRPGDTYVADFSVLHYLSESRIQHYLNNTTVKFNHAMNIKFKCSAGYGGNTR